MKFDHLLMLGGILILGVIGYQHDLHKHLPLPGRDVIAAAAEDTRSLAPAEPMQMWVDEQDRVARDLDGHSVLPIASYEVTALALSTRRYHEDRAAEISPVDIAMSWGDLSRPSEAAKVRVWQRGRFGSLRSRKKLSLPPSEVGRHFANLHVIPANPDVEKKALSVQRGDLVTLKGYLVRVSAPDGFTWNSSTSRTDKGDGACEIMLVEEVVIEEPLG